VVGVRWAFWRRTSSPRDRDQSLPLPDDIGLPAPERPPPPRPQVDDPADGSGPRPVPSTSSGATPDAAAGWISAGGGTGLPALPAEVPEPHDAGQPLDPGEQELCRWAVVEAVTAVLSGEPQAVDRALEPAGASLARQAFAVCAAGQVLAQRIPALSGVSDPAAVAEHEGDLLRAYAELLSERAQPARARAVPEVPRELLLHVAHVCALGGPVVPDPTAALSDEEPAESAGRSALSGDSASGRDRTPVRGWPVGVLPGRPADQLRALCVLLAQTARDGAPGAQGLAKELRATVC